MPRRALAILLLVVTAAWANEPTPPPGGTHQVKLNGHIFTLPVGFEIKWKAVAMFADGWSGEESLTVAQGLPNGKHTLEIVGSAPIRAIRVYRPPVAP